MNKSELFFTITDIWNIIFEYSQQLTGISEIDKGVLRYHNTNDYEAYLRILNGKSNNIGLDIQLSLICERKCGTYSNRWSYLFVHFEHYRHILFENYTLLDKRIIQIVSNCPNFNYIQHPMGESAVTTLTNCKLLNQNLNDLIENMNNFKFVWECIACEIVWLIVVKKCDSSLFQLLCKSNIISDIMDIDNNRICDMIMSSVDEYSIVMFELLLTEFGKLSTFHPRWIAHGNGWKQLLIKKLFQSGSIQFIRKMFDIDQDLLNMTYCLTGSDLLQGLINSERLLLSTEYMNILVVVDLLNVQSNDSEFKIYLQKYYNKIYSEMIICERFSRVTTPNESLCIDK